jgi:anti-sigma B factor antagonist
MRDDILTVAVERDGDVTLLRLAGELDLYTAPRLRDHLPAVLADDGDVAVDLSSLSFIDSTGLGDITRIHRQLEAQDRRLILRSPTPVVLRVLEITGLTSNLDIER